MKADNIEKIVESMKKNNFNEFKYESGEKIINLTLPPFQVVNKSQVIDKTLEKNIEKKSNLVEVKSKLVGRFYSTLTSDKVPTLRVNDKIKKGENLCMIESMNIENIIKSEYDGILKEVLLDDGDIVMYGQTIMKIEVEN